MVALSSMLPRSITISVSSWVLRSCRLAPIRESELRFTPLKSSVSKVLTRIS